MSVYKMNNVVLMKFLELYQEYECLWNVNLAVYKDRDARDDAFRKIAEEMSIEGFGPREVAQKIKNIRSAYYQEVKKIKASIKSGASADSIYRPRVLWFNFVDGFLKKSSKINHTESNLANDESQVTSEKETEKQADLVVSHASEDPFAETSVNQTEDNAVISKPITSSKKRRIQNRSNSPTYIGQALEKLEAIQKNQSSETEFDVWCRSLAKQLNNMDTSSALKLQLEIQTLVSNVRIASESRKQFHQSGQASPQPSYPSCSTYVHSPWNYNNHHYEQQTESPQPENQSLTQYTDLEPSTIKKTTFAHKQAEIPIIASEDESVESILSSLYSPPSNNTSS